jgi:hypothetical protein
MNIPDTIKTLSDFNAWRRGDEVIEQPDPADIGHAIDIAILHLQEKHKHDQEVSNEVARMLREFRTSF